MSGFYDTITLLEIEDAIRHLSSEGRAERRAWFVEFDAAEWDRQLEADVAGGRLDWLAQEAREDWRRSDSAGLTAVEGRSHG